MPMYEYGCETCGHQLEALQKFSDDRLVTCPGCGEDALKRLISQTSFVLKGSGWYVTDYARKGSANGGKPGSDAGKEAGASASSPSEGASSSGDTSSSSGSSSSSSSAASNSSASSGGDKPATKAAPTSGSAGSS